LLKTLPDDTEVLAWVDGKGWVAGPRQRTTARLSLNKGRSVEKAIAEWSEEVSDDGSDEEETVAIVGFKDPEVSRQAVESLRERRSGIKVLQLGLDRSRAVLNNDKRTVRWGDVLAEGVEKELQLLALQDRVRDLRGLLKDAGRIAILLQDDPDPDGLASALALRKVLGRNAQTAPVVSFGHITRPENMAMSRLLDIEVEHLSGEKDLEAFDRLVLVDCQPSFFKGREILPDAILDHHPEAPGAREAEFHEIRVDLGATSTLLTQYLRAAQIDVSQRLATALLYGIKADTLLLNREVSDSDLDAFVHLYPRINNNTLRRIERPELPIAYLDVLRKALGRLRSEDGLVLLYLGEVEREEWIAQAADFALQIEGSQWALGAGVIDGRVVISGRNCGHIQHCGELFKQLFNGGSFGCAGGHRTMAKAIIPTDKWRERHGAKALGATSLPKILFETVRKALAEKEAARLAAKES
jgi:nanoRNase/pAp phosphatase (c-di-AMP/oligoRNAs hydrolase)